VRGNARTCGAAHAAANRLERRRANNNICDLAYMPRYIAKETVDTNKFYLFIIMK